MQLVYLAQEPYNRDDGSGPVVTRAAFFYESDAQTASVGRGTQSLEDGIVIPLVVYHSIKEYEEYLQLKSGDPRAAALAKLTPDERRLLNLE